MSTPADVLRDVRRGDVTAVREGIRGLDDIGRTVCATEARLLRATQPTPVVARAALVAEVGCATSAASAARTLRAGVAPDLVRDVVGALVDRSPSWLPDLLDRLAARVDDAGLDLVDALRVVLRAGYPRTAAYLCAMVRRAAEVAAAGGTPVLDRLRADPELCALVPEILAADGGGAALGHRAGGTLDLRGPRPAVLAVTDGVSWPAALAVACREGLVERDLVLDGVLQALTRGNARGRVGGLVATLDALSPTPDETARRVPVLMRLLERGPARAAAGVQRLLRAADGTRPLGTDLVLDASAVVLARPDKALVRGQLGWLETLARRDPARTGDIARTLFHGLRNEYLDLQERTVQSLERVLASAPAAVRTSLAAQAPPVRPLLADRLAACLGAGAAAVTVPGPRSNGRALPRRLVCAVPDAASLAVTVAGFLDGLDPMEGERVLDAVLRLGAAEPAVLAEALAPHRARLQGGPDGPPSAEIAADPVAAMCAELLGTGRVERRAHPRRQGPPPVTWWSERRGARRALSLRTREIAMSVRAGRKGRLLALPTEETGHVDPSVLVARLAAYEAEGEQPLAHDLAQAALRLPRYGLEGAKARARRLESPAGRWLTTHLAEGVDHDATAERYPAHVPSYAESDGRPEWPHADRSAAVPLVRLVAGPGGAHHDGLSAALFTLPPAEVLAATPVAAREGATDAAMLLAAIPSHREVVAAWMVPTAAATSQRLPAPARHTLAMLPLAQGPVGAATALLLAYVLNSTDGTVRTAASGALSAFAESGDLDGVDLGEALAAVLVSGLGTTRRTAGALGEVASSGVRGRELVGVAALCALPAALAGDVRDCGELMPLAAEAAMATGGRRSWPALDELAGREGNTRLVVEARRLRAALTDASAGPVR